LKIRRLDVPTHLQAEKAKRLNVVRRAGPSTKSQQRSRKIFRAREINLQNFYARTFFLKKNLPHSCL
jgi:hypothetical protein